MILETTYRSKEIKKTIDEAIGEPVSFFKRFKIGGVGSQRLIFLEASKDFEHLIYVDNKSKFCNIELREEGIILHFRSRLETFAWVVPYRIMSWFKAENSFSIYAGSEFVRLAPAHNAAINNKFINKMLNMKSITSQKYSILS